jgi:hypothetical protein
LALELLSYARNRLRCQPQFVLCDAWYPSQTLLKRIRDYGWDCVCQLKKNRRFEGTALAAYLRQPSWQAVGHLSGGLKGRVVRYRRKDYATNRLGLTGKAVRAHYRRRHAVEEVLRVLKSHGSLEACQAGYWRRGAIPPHCQPRAPEHHITLCLVAYLVIERERLDQGIPWRQLKQRLFLTGRQLSLPALERVRRAA